jgi:hypothetical protein
MTLINRQQAKSQNSVWADHATHMPLPISEPTDVLKNVTRSPTMTGQALTPGKDDEASELFRKLVATLINKNIASALAAYLTDSRFSITR